jgi:peroxiredoxin
MRAATLLFLVAAACGGGGASRPTTDTPAPAGAPPIELALPAVDGGDLSLASYRGKVVVLHVFTTWSLAAQAEVPALSDADQAEDVVVIGIALDPEGRMLVAPWRNGAGVRYLVAVADEPTRAGQSALGALPAVPITILLDRAGRIAGRADRQLAPEELGAMIDTARAR